MRYQRFSKLLANKNELRRQTVPLQKEEASATSRSWRGFTVLTRADQMSPAAEVRNFKPRHHTVPPLQSGCRQLPIMVEGKEKGLCLGTSSRDRGGISQTEGVVAELAGSMLVGAGLQISSKTVRPSASA